MLEQEGSDGQGEPGPPARGCPQRRCSPCSGLTCAVTQSCVVFQGSSYVFPSETFPLLPCMVRAFCPFNNINYTLILCNFIVKLFSQLLLNTDVKPEKFPGPNLPAALGSCCCITELAPWEMPLWALPVHMVKFPSPQHRPLWPGSLSTLCNSMEQTLISSQTPRTSLGQDPSTSSPRFHPFEILCSLVNQGLMEPSAKS